MTWVTIFKALLQLALTISKHLERRQLIGEGEAKAIAKGLEESNARLVKAIEIRRKMANTPDDADNDGMSDDDGYRRD